MIFGLRRVPEQSDEPEWMDTPGHHRDVVVQNLGDLRRCNRLLGGVRLTVLPLARLAAHLPRGETLVVLDVATGGADIPRAVARWARRRGRPIFLVASDVSEQFVGLAREQSAGFPEVTFVVADARSLPFAAGAFHVTTCSLALHHMLRQEAEAMFGELGRCARRAVIVNDIVRGWLGYVGAIVATRLGSRNPLTWHDGPLSVLRAYTKEEMLDLARGTGLRPVRWDGFLGYRVALTALPEGAWGRAPSGVQGPERRSRGAPCGGLGAKPPVIETPPIPLGEGAGG